MKPKSEETKNQFLINNPDVLRNYEEAPEDEENIVPQKTMRKFIALSPRTAGEVKTILINVDQIVAVEVFENICRIRTAIIEPGAHGPMPLTYDVRKSDFEKEFASVFAD